MNATSSVIEEKRNKVLGMYKERKISLAKAAEILSIDVCQMIDIVRKESIYLDCSKAELREDLQGLKRK